MFRLTLSLAAALVVFGCGEAETPSAQPAGPAAPATPAATPPSTATVEVPYDFTQPAATFQLPESLREISGITVLPDGRLAAVQDETGVLYTLDAATGAVLNEQTFAGEGDYEDVEFAAGAVWVLTSNGSLLELPATGGTPEEHDTPLRGRCDAEGLALDAAQNRLLIACKEDPGEGLDDNEVRAVYAFDLTARTLAASPVFTLSRSALDAAENFKPSALAVHPTTGEVYVMSSVRNAIAVVRPDGQIAGVVELPEATNAQPEGLAFTSDGTLYLSNEGPEGPATLQRFDAR